MLKRLLTSAAVACTLFGVPALADYIRPSDDHIRILKAVQSKGIVVSINDREACDHETSGMYSYGHTRAGARYADFIVCQDNGRPGGPIASWTENDLDTIRHEAAHIIQDCIDGKIANMSLDTVFDDPKKLAQFAQKAGLTGALRTNWLFIGD